MGGGEDKGQMLGAGMFTEESIDKKTKKRTDTGRGGAWLFGTKIRIKLREWHHVMLTYDGKQLMFYVDGKAYKTEESIGGPMRIVENPIFIGSSVTWKDERFWGAITDVRIYNRCLLGNEARELHKALKVFLKSGDRSVDLIADEGTDLGFSDDSDY